MDNSTDTSSFKFLWPLGANLLTHKTTKEGGSERGAPANSEARRKAIYKYNHSPAKAAAMKRYRATGKHALACKRWRKTEAGMILEELRKRNPSYRIYQMQYPRVRNGRI